MNFPAQQSIGLGLAALGRPGYINLGHDADLGENKSVESLESRAHKVLDAAWDGGIRYFDAARSYGKGEAFLSGWIEKRGYDAEQFFVASKWGYRYTANWQVGAETHEIKEHTLSQLKAQYQESQSLLGHYLDLYQIHSASLDSGVLENKRVLNQLAGMKNDGMVIGLSLSGAQQGETLERALSVERDGKLLFDAVQATWNILNPAIGEQLSAAHGADMRVVIKEALANGRLTSRNNSSNFARKRGALEAIALEKEVAIDAVAIAAVLAQPWADVVLSGAARIEHLKSNLRALDISLSADELEGLLSLQEGNEEYLQIRSQLDWN